MVNFSTFVWDQANSELGFKLAMVDLGAHKHLWDGGSLRIAMEKFLRSLEFASVVNTSRCLTSIVPGSYRVLSGILQGKSKQMYLIDKANNPAKQLPIVDIVSFLFENSDMGDSHAQETKLIIETRYPSKYQLYEEVVRSIKQKFLESSRPPIFKFAKLHNGDMDWPQAHDFTLDHPHSNKKLLFRVIVQSGFSLTCSTH